MDKETKTKKKRSHDRADGNVQTSVSMSAEVMELGKKLAKNDMRTFSNLLASLIAEEARRRGLGTEVGNG